MGASLDVLSYAPMSIRSTKQMSADGSRSDSEGAMTTKRQTNEGASRFVPESQVRFDFNWTERGFRTFVDAAQLEVFTLPGGARLVDRAAFWDAVNRLAVPLTLYTASGPTPIQSTPGKEPSQ